MLVLAAAGYFGQKVEQFWEKAGLVLGKKTVPVWSIVKLNSGGVCNGKIVGLRRDLSRWVSEFKNL